jgi:hypothetical protein
VQGRLGAEQERGHDGRACGLDLVSRGRERAERERDHERDLRGRAEVAVRARAHDVRHGCEAGHCDERETRNPGSERVPERADHATQQTREREAPHAEGARAALELAAAPAPLDAHDQAEPERDRKTEDQLVLHHGVLRSNGRAARVQR